MQVILSKKTESKKCVHNEDVSIGLAIMGNSVQGLRVYLLNEENTLVFTRHCCERIMLRSGRKYVSMLESVYFFLSGVEDASNLYYEPGNKFILSTRYGTLLGKREAGWLVALTFINLKNEREDQKELR